MDVSDWHATTQKMKRLVNREEGERLRFNCSQKWNDRREQNTLLESGKVIWVSHHRRNQCDALIDVSPILDNPIIMEGMGGGGRRLGGAAVGREPGRRRGEDDDDETVSASGRPRAGPKFGWAFYATSMSYKLEPS